MTNAKIQMSKGGEEGVTLVISIVLLASVTFISFALSALILREIGAARLLLHTEPALSGANAGGEVALYRLFREAGGVATTGGTLSSQTNVVYNITAELYDNPYLFSILLQEEITVGLYDAQDPGNQNTGYVSVTVSNTSANGSPISVSLVSWSEPNLELYGQNVIAGNSTGAIALDSADDRYLITLKNLPASNIATGEILAQPQGVPSDSPQLEVTGTSGDVQRKIEINIQ